MGSEFEPEGVVPVPVTRRQMKLSDRQRDKALVALREHLR